jgi:O-antigen/teichoic acid export membrane protein
MESDLKEGAVKIAWFQIPDYFIIACSTWGSRVLTTLASLVSIRILLSGLGVDQYATYAVLMGTAGWLSLADLGAGQSLQNYISESRARRQDYAAYVRAGAALIAGISLVSVGLILAMGHPLSASLLRQFTFLNDQQKYTSFVAVLSLALGASAGSLVFKIWYAEHKGYLANVIATLGAIAALAGVYVVTKSGVENKLLWCLVAANVPGTALALGSLWVRFRRTPVSPIREQAKHILKRGSKFWMFNLAAAMVVQVDYIVLSQYVPPDQIVVYNIGAKIFAIAGFMFSAVHQAFWPVCAEAVIHGDWGRIGSFSRGYLGWGVAFLALFTGAVSLFRNQLGDILSSHGKIAMPVLPAAFIVSLGLMYVIRLWTDLFAVILQSMNDLRVLLISAGLQAAVGLLLQITLVPRFGIYGTVAALSLSWLLTVSWVLPMRVLRKQKERVAAFA